MTMFATTSQIEPENKRRKPNSLDGDDATPGIMRGFVELHLVACFLRRRLGLIAGVTAVCFVIATAFLMMAVPQFTASAQILFNPPRDKSLGAEGALSDGPLDPMVLQNQVYLIQSATLLERVIEQERLSEDPEFANGPTLGVLGRIRKSLGQPAAELEILNQQNVPAVQALQEKLKVERLSRTYIISISITVSDRDKATRLINAVAHAYVADRIAARAVTSAHSVRLINPPMRPTVPSYPKIELILALALFGGSVLGVAAAITIETMGRGFTRSKQVEAVIGVPVLGMLGRLTGAEMKALQTFGASKARMASDDITPREGLVNEVMSADFSSKGDTLADHWVGPPHLLLAKPLACFSEAIRMLRFNIQRTSRRKLPKIIQVTSSEPGEGKTTVALCLAISAAVSDLRVAFVDFDLRRAWATKCLDLEDSTGLMEFFSGRASLAETLHFDQITGVHVIPAGCRSNDLVKFLKPAQLKKLLTTLGAKFDYVVIDSPALGPVTDAGILARMADKIVLVIKWNDTPQEIVQRAIRHLIADRERVGVVLNFIDQRRSPKYNRYEYAQFGSKSYQCYYTA
jgi:capsular exopolysaccharide synthesis family protein